MTKEKITSESPFYKVLEYWADEVIEHEKRMPEFCTEVESNRRITLKSGMQVKITIGRNVHEDNDDD